MKDFEEKKSKVLKWLKSLYGNEPLPKVTEESMEQLYDLMEFTQKEEQGMETIAEFQKYQMAEYSLEVGQMRERMENVGFKSAEGLKRSIKDVDLESLNTDLAQSAELLGLDDPSEFSMDMALADLKKKTAFVPLEMHLKKVKSEKDKRALLNDLSLLNKTDQALNMAKTEAKIDQGNISQIFKKHQFMQEKEKEYLKLQEKYVATIRKSGYNKATSHEAILNLKKKLDDVENDTKPVLEKLEAFKGLPPSLELANAELAGKEQFLQTLKSRLQNEVQKIQL